jgi:hypothetical protein
VLSSPLSTLFATVGTVLTAVVIFAPSRPRATATVSPAPPREPPPVERWSPALRDDEPFEPSAPPAPQWPVLADRRADGCEVAVRLALVEGLGTVGTSWADAILRRARDDDPDPVVRSAAAAALRAED